ncbi:GNAT family N-acetyltransferase [Bacillus sp. FSL W7-1360]
MVVEILQITSPAVATDIHKLQMEAYTREARLIEYPDIPPLRETIQEIKGFPGIVYGIYGEQHQKLLGVIFIERFEDGNEHAATIVKLIVDGKYSRKGIGRALVKYVQTKYNTLYVSTARRNTPAIRLYENGGFIIQSQKVIDKQLTLCMFKWENFF